MNQIIYEGSCEFCDKNFKKQSNLCKHLNPKHKHYCKLAYKFNLWHERKIKDDFEIQDEPTIDLKNNITQRNIEFLNHPINNNDLIDTILTHQTNIYKLLIDNFNK
jgi:hypothetical protein